MQPKQDSGRSIRKPLSGKALATAATAVVLLTAIVVVVLWWPATSGLSGRDLVTARFDALRIGLSIGVGSGGVIVLYLAWRRQRSTEDTLAHQERVADATEKDAVERRITDLYTKAADQLGSDKAPVRLAGLYALERLAQDNPNQRRAIVNVLCAYLRMPFELPAGPPAPPNESGSGMEGDKNQSGDQQVPLRDPDRELQRYRELLVDHRERVQEREVRQTAQRILSIHSHPGHGGVNNPVDTFWPSLELDFTGATLDRLDFSNCHVKSFTLTNARVDGVAWFEGARFSGGASFDGTGFGSVAWFKDAKFSGSAWFDRARFASLTLFEGVEFATTARFEGVAFVDSPNFSRAKFAYSARFTAAEFTRGARFDGAEFASTAWFDGAKFAGAALFDGATFAGPVRAKGATFANDIPYQFAIPGEGTEHRPTQGQSLPSGQPGSTDQTA